MKRQCQNCEHGSVYGLNCRSPKKCRNWSQYRPRLNWEYSRTWRKHWVDDGDLYRVRKDLYHLWEIRDNAPYGFIHRREHGYRLLHRGVLVDQAKTVKELKTTAAQIEFRETNPIKKENHVSST